MPLSKYLRPSIVAPILCLIYAIYIALAAQHVYVWVTPSSKLAPEELEPYAYSDWGYDGFYVYLIARDPIEAVQYLDAAPYRFQRILLPAMARLLSFGQREALPYVLLGINLIFLGIGTYALEYLLKHSGKGYSAWYAAGYAFSLGLFGSARLAMTEPLAYGLALIGIVLAQRKNWGASAIIFALAALAKETILFFPAAYVVHLLYQRKWKTAISFGLITLIPWAIWQVMIYGYFGVWGLGSGGSSDTGFSLIPFGAYFQMLQIGGIVSFLLLNILLFPFVIYPLLWSFWRCFVDFREKQWTIATQLLFFNILILPFTPFSTFAEPIAIFRFIVGLQIALTWYTAQKGQVRALRYSTLWLVTGILVIGSDLYTI
jgi:hypothetical protein